MLYFNRSIDALSRFFFFLAFLSPTLFKFRRRFGLFICLLMMLILFVSEMRQGISFVPEFHFFRLAVASEISRKIV